MPVAFCYLIKLMTNQCNQCTARQQVKIHLPRLRLLLFSLDKQQRTNKTLKRGFFCPKLTASSAQLYEILKTTYKFNAHIFRAEFVLSLGLIFPDDTILGEQELL